MYNYVYETMRVYCVCIGKMKANINHLIHFKMDYSQV